LAGFWPEEAGACQGDDQKTWCYQSVTGVNTHTRFCEKSDPAAPNGEGRAWTEAYFPTVELCKAIPVDPLDPSCRDQNMSKRQIDDTYAVCIVKKTEADENKARVKAVDDAKAAAEADRPRIEADVKAKIEAERAQIEAEAKAAIRAQIEADLRAKAKADAKAKAEAEAKADIEAATKAKDAAAAEAKKQEDARMEAEIVARHEDSVREARAADEAAARASAAEVARVEDEARAKDEAAARFKAKEKARIETEAKAAHEAVLREARSKEDAAALADDEYWNNVKDTAEKQGQDEYLAVSCNELPQDKQRLQRDLAQYPNTTNKDDKDAVKFDQIACDVLRQRGKEALIKFH
jgi:hypothetical protein